MTKYMASIIRTIAEMQEVMESGEITAQDAEEIEKELRKIDSDLDELLTYLKENQ